MSYSNINKSTNFFNTKLYTGTDANLSITGVNFQPDLTWIKSRSATGAHQLMDAVRGASKRLASNSSGSEDATNGLLSFDTDGFSMGDNATSHNMNGSGITYASWNWLGANGTATNYDGSITSTVSANTTAGFSIVSYTGTGANATVGHGLGVTPKMIIVKNRDGTQGWAVYHHNLPTGSAGQGSFLSLNTTDSYSDSSTFWNSTAPTNSVFSIGTSGWTNDSGNNYIAYCFAEKTGYSKIGSYKGGTNTFVYTGFKPKFILGKEASASNGYHWHLFVPELTGRIEASNTVAEYTDYLRVVDWNSNGFRWGTSLNNWDNSDGRTYIYYAVGQSMVGTNNVPCTAGSTDG